MRTHHWRLLARQTSHLTWASLKSRYRKTWAGFLWVLINPLVMFGVQSVVFRKFLNIQVPNFYVFLLSGLLPWIFLVQTVQMGTPTLVANGGLLKSFNFHPGVLVGSAALDNFINFLLSLLLIALPAVLLSDTRPMGLVWGLVCLIPFLLGTFSLTMFTALFNVFFRDTNFVLGFLFSVAYFITPIFYPVEYVPADYRWLVDWNIFYQLMRPFRLAVYDPDPYAWVSAWGPSFALACALAGLSALYWRRKLGALYVRI